MKSQSKADLHIHTTFSDGTFTPEEIVRESARMNLNAIAITDHDTVDGLDEAEDAGKFYCIKIVRGIELTAYHDNLELHILGYLIDKQRDELFRQKLGEFIKYREHRMSKMIDKLKQFDFEISFEEVKQKASGAILLRPHLVEVMLEKKYVNYAGEAYDRFIGLNAPAYVPKYRLSPEEAIKLIKSAGGVSGLAHPGLLNKDDLIKDLKEMGLEALEVFHTFHDNSAVKKYSSLAEKLDLVPTGGSDFHGVRSSQTTLGGTYVHIDTIKLLEERQT